MEAKDKLALFGSAYTDLCSVLEATPMLPRDFRLASKLLMDMRQLFMSALECNGGNDL